MSKWLSARVVHLKEGEYTIMDDSERAVSAKFETPHIWVVVVKESYRNPMEPNE